MQGKTLRWVVAATVVGVLSLGIPGVVVAPAEAKSENTRVQAKKLEPCCGEPEPEAEGSARRDIHVNKGVVKSDRLTGRVEIPVPSAGLGITDAVAAAAADIRLVLSHDGGVTAYAECLLAFQELEGDEEEGDEAQYRVDVRLRPGRPLELKKGSCTDLVTLLAVVPDLQDGDLVTAVLVVDPADRTQDVLFLQGTAELK